MGYTRQKPPVQIAKVNSGSISSSQSSPTGYSLNRHSQYSSESHPSKAEELTTPVQRASSWWDSVDDQAASNSTPTAATFMQVEESSVQARNDGFISLMDSHSYSIGPGAHQADHTHPTRSSSQYTIEEDVEDDLGLGNSKPKPKTEKAEEDESGREGKEEKPAAAAPAAAQSKGEKMNSKVAFGHHIYSSTRNSLHWRIVVQSVVEEERYGFSWTSQG